MIVPILSRHSPEQLTSYTSLATHIYGDMYMKLVTSLLGQKYILLRGNGIDQNTQSPTQTHAQPHTHSNTRTVTDLAQCPTSHSHKPCAMPNITQPHTHSHTDTPCAMPYTTQSHTHSHTYKPCAMPNITQPHTHSHTRTAIGAPLSISK